MTRVKNDVHAPSRMIRRSVRSKPTRLSARASCGATARPTTARGGAFDEVRRAAECIELAKRAKTEIDKQKLLHIAEAWRKLAEDESIPADQDT